MRTLPLTILRGAPVALLALILILTLGSCSMVSGLLFGGDKKAAVEKIKVVAEINANQNSASQLDIVFVYDSNAATLLPKTGPAWFEQKNALLAGMASAVDVVSLQVPPATLADVNLPLLHGKAIGVYVFANYLSAAGQPVSNITPYKNVTIWLTPTSVLYKTN